MSVRLDIDEYDELVFNTFLCFHIICCYYIKQLYYKGKVNIQEKCLNFLRTEKYEVNDKGTISTRSGI